MTNFDFLSYFHTLADGNVKIKGSEGNIHFGRVAALSLLNEFLRNMADRKGYQLICIDMEQGKMVDHNSDNILANRFFSFFIIHPLAESVTVTKETVLADCRTVFLQILAKMKYDKGLGVNGLLPLDLNSFSYQQIGAIGHHWYGYSCSFALHDPTALVYNINHWEFNMEDPDPGGGEEPIIEE